MDSLIGMVFILGLIGFPVGLFSDRFLFPLFYGGKR